MSQTVVCTLKNFNPLSLYRERLVEQLEEMGNIISIHSPYTGRDARNAQKMPGQKDFNPLSLYRERRMPDDINWEARDFNPLSLYRERRWNRLFMPKY